MFSFVLSLSLFSMELDRTGVSGSLVSFPDLSCVPPAGRTVHKLSFRSLLIFSSGVGRWLEQIV